MFFALYQINTYDESNFVILRIHDLESKDPHLNSRFDIGFVILDKSLNL